jgi:hypothetical protein
MTGTVKSCAIIYRNAGMFARLKTAPGRASQQFQLYIRRSPMRNAVYLVSILLSCLFGSLALAAPVLEVPEQRFDFGEVFQGDKVLHVFEFTNQGDEALLIDRVRSSCGCTAVLVSEKNLPPGGKGELQANFDSTRFRGAVSKTIYLYSNDPVRPVMQLQLQGKVLEIVAVEPGQVNFGQVNAKRPVTSTVLLRNQGIKPLTLGVPRSTATELLVKMPKASFASGDEVSLELQLTPKPGQPRFSGYVLIPVDGLPKNELRIPVYATIIDQ